ncbi:MAG TPA: ABC transporter permease [Chitinophagaceae bacterium]
MVSNYFKLAVRNLGKRKGYSLLNILGLAIGITCCLLIFQYVSFERSYDNSPKNAKQIARLRLDSYQQGKLSWQSATVYPAFGPTMKKDFPEVEEFCRLIDADVLLSNDKREVKFSEQKGYYADPSFISMFSLQLLKGDPNTVLDAPDKILLSESMARKYFGNEDAVGKRLTLRDPGYTRTLQVTGVFKEFPSNSHLIINHLLSYSTLGNIMQSLGDTSNATETAWGWYDFYIYLQIKKGTELKQLESKLPAFCDRYINNREWNKANNVKSQAYLIPLRDIHLYSNFNQEAEVNGNGRSVAFLFLIGFFIMGIAWINYINLATARSVERAKEVGIRKVMGALRTDLITQFLLESLLLNIVSLLIALGAVTLLTSGFNQMIGRDSDSVFVLQPVYWYIFASIFIAGTLLSGIYPAFVISGYQPVTVLKGLFKNSSGGLNLRKGLIILQFATSVVLIAGTIIVYMQVNYMRKQQLGVNIKQTLVLDGAVSVQDSLYQNTFQPFKTALLQQSGVKSMTASSSVMSKEIYWTSSVKRVDLPNATSMTLYHLGIDHDFIPSFEMKLLAGRNFSESFPTDNKAAILNETAVANLGYSSPEKALNGKLRRNNDTLTIIGVVQNFHQEGLRKSIEPQIILLRPNSRSAYSVKIESADVSKTIAVVKTTWDKYFPNDPFKYYFLDEVYDQQYKADKLYGKVFSMFSFLAILIACFGLLGLSAYNILQRTKEIGIRKVMGASVQNVLFILSKNFLTLVGISFLLAVPITWWVMHNWLQDFAYRINMPWWVFLIAGVLAALIAFITISFQAIKAALANPIKSLRTE